MVQVHINLKIIPNGQNADDSGQSHAKLMLWSSISISGHEFTKIKFTIFLKIQKRHEKKYIAVPVYSFRIHLLIPF